MIEPLSFSRFILVSCTLRDRIFRLKKFSHFREIGHQKTSSDLKIEEKPEKYEKFVLNTNF